MYLVEFCWLLLLQKTEEMADAAVPRFCHRLPLPCLAGASAGRSLTTSSCMQVDLVEKMMVSDMILIYFMKCVVNILSC